LDWQSAILLAIEKTWFAPFFFWGILRTRKENVGLFYNLVPLEGVITKIDGKKFYINLGKKSKIKKWHRFLPVTPGVPIPPAGKESKQGTILEVTEVYDDYCVAVLDKGAATNIGVNTIVSSFY